MVASSPDAGLSLEQQEQQGYKPLAQMLLELGPVLDFEFALEAVAAAEEEEGEGVDQTLELSNWSQKQYVPLVTQWLQSVLNPASCEYCHIGDLKWQRFRDSAPQLACHVELPEPAHPEPRLDLRGALYERH